MSDLSQYFVTVNTDQYFCVSSKRFAYIFFFLLSNDDWFHHRVKKMIFTSLKESMF